VRCNERPLPGDFVLVSHDALPGEPGPIPVDATRWAAGLPPDAWPAGFAASGKVCRNEVFALAERWRARDVSSVQLAAGVLAWGHGIRGYGPFRTGRILNRELAGERLEAALGGLRQDTVAPAVLEDCYERFTTTAKLPGLGPAFFTKLLYFTGYRRGKGGDSAVDPGPGRSGPAAHSGGAGRDVPRGLVDQHLADLPALGSGPSRPSRVRF
jgi:hypothetical protein